MELIIRRLIVSIGLHGLEIGQPHIQIFNCLLIVCNGLVRTKLLAKPKRATNALGAIILIALIIGSIVITVVELMLPAPGTHRLRQLFLQKLRLLLHSRDLDGLHMLLQSLESRLVSSTCSSLRECLLIAIILLLICCHRAAI